MYNVIDIDEKRKQYEKKRAAQKIQMEKEIRLKNLIADMETILDMIAKEEIVDIDMVFKFKDIDCYYGYRDELDKESIKNRVESIFKQVEFIE